MKSKFSSFCAITAAFGVACASSASAAVSETVGFNTIPCLPGSDTIVSVPLRQSGSIKGVLAAAPSIDAQNEAATLTLSSPATEGVDDLAGTHYFQFTSGTNNGQYFMIMANGLDQGNYTVDIDTNGADLSNVVATDTYIIAKFWTLNALFPPAEATTAWDETTGEPNGHAIVASSSTSPRSRMTQVFLLSGGIGVNKSASEIFYITNDVWESATGNPDPGNAMLLPDSFLVIRHPSTVANNTKYTCVGEVAYETISIPLATSADSDNDVILGLPRPLPVKLSALGLAGTSAFESSGGTSPRARKDLLIVFDNAQTATNKNGKIFYYDGTNWLEATNNNALSNDFEIPAGTGFVIRKVASTNGVVEWENNPNY